MVLQDKPQYMKNQINPNWLNADEQARINPPPILFTKMEYTEDIQDNIIKVKMQHNPASSMLDTY